ncbi:hypothetical protein J6590_054846 [Homalodisca vitripennis]|nr:hypothetical protein J6590_054846 [Homalodisca vitripennis]
MTHLYISGLQGHRVLLYVIFSCGVSSKTLYTYVPPLPTTMDELRNRITTAVESVTQDMLAAVWDEFEYHIDICRARTADITCQIRQLTDSQLPHSCSVLQLRHNGKSVLLGASKTNDHLDNISRL